MKDSYVVKVIREILSMPTGTPEMVISLTSSVGSEDKMKLGILRALKHLGCFTSFELFRAESYMFEDLRVRISPDGHRRLEELLQME